MEEITTYQLGRDGHLEDVTEKFHKEHTIDESVTERFRYKLLKTNVEKSKERNYGPKEGWEKYYKRAFSDIFIYQHNISKQRCLVSICKNSDGESYYIVFPNRYMPNYDITILAEDRLYSKYKHPVLNDIDILINSIDNKWDDADNDSLCKPELSTLFLKIGTNYGDYFDIPIPLDKVDEDNIKNYMSTIIDISYYLRETIKESNKILNK